MEPCLCVFLCIPLWNRSYVNRESYRGFGGSIRSRIEGSIGVLFSIGPPIRTPYNIYPLHVFHSVYTVE